MLDIDALQARVHAAPRLPLGAWPTPFLPLHGLHTRLCDEGALCPNLWIKREDLTPLGAGGNKVRKLEHVLAKAREQGANVLLNTGEMQSNQVVQTAAAAAHLGMGCELFLGRTKSPCPKEEQETGNYFLCQLLNAVIHLLPPAADRAAAMLARAEELKAEGKRPFIIPRGSSTVEGSLGSLRCFFELLEQARERGFTPSAIAITVGSSGTTAGFLVGAQALAMAGGPRIDILAYDTFGPEYPESAHARIMTHAEESWQFLDLPGRCGEERLRLSCDFVGPGYARPYPGMLEAVRLLAAVEGVILDPNYTGKSMTGLLHALRSNAYAQHEHVIYIHTGGLPALFALRKHFL